jgi:hypothetical protein
MKAIPSAVHWLLLSHIPVAAAAIYAAFYVFGAGETPFILALVGVSARFRRGWTRRPSADTDQTVFHIFIAIYAGLAVAEIVSPKGTILQAGFVVCTGIWCGVLACFAKHVVLLVNDPVRAWMKDGADPRLIPRWTQAGCALSGLSMYVFSTQTQSRNNY